MDPGAAYVAAPASRKPNTQRRDAFIHYRGLGALSGLSSEDSQLFDFCRLSSVHSLNSLEWSSFWCNIIPAAAHTEPAVLYALLALGASHQAFSKRYMPQGDFDQALLARSYAHSSKAMRHLQRILNDSDMHSYDIVLMVSYMLLIMETISGRQPVALLHLQHARRIIRLIQSRRRPDVDSTVIYLPDCPKSLEDDLIQAFSRLDVQSINWGAEASEFQLVDHPSSTDPHGIEIAPWFESTFDASRYLLFLIGECVRLVSSQAELTTSEATLRQTRLLTRLAQWQESCQCSPFYYAQLCDTPNRSTDNDRFTLLRLHHALLTLTVTTCLSRDDEMAFDDLLPLLLTIQELAARLVDGVPTLGLDMAVIQPSILVATHCRQPAIRRQALDTLVLARKKGLWDTILDIRGVEAVIEYEELSASYQHTPDVDCRTPLDLGSLFPEYTRVSSVETSFTDDTHTEIDVSLRRKQPCEHHIRSNAGLLYTPCGCEPHWIVWEQRHKASPVSDSYPTPITR